MSDFKRDREEMTNSSAYVGRRLKRREVEKLRCVQEYIETQIATLFCVCVHPQGITYHISDMTDCPAFSLICCQSSAAHHIQPTIAHMKEKSTQLQFLHGTCVLQDSLMYTLEHCAPLSSLYPHGSHLQSEPCSDFQSHIGSFHFHLTIIPCKIAKR